MEVVQFLVHQQDLDYQVVQAQEIHLQFHQLKEQMVVMLIVEVDIDQVVAVEQ